MQKEYGLPHRCAHRFAMTRILLGVRCMSAAAHMGAALQRNLQNMRRGGGSAPPVHGRRIFIKLSFRGAQRRGNPFSLCGEGAAQGTGYGLPHRCAHRFAMTRILLGVRCMSGGGSAPPVHGRRIFIKLSFRGAQRRGNPFPPCSEGAVRGGCGLPHRCAHRFAMTRILLGVRCMSAAG